jgi:uncharacterized protein
VLEDELLMALPVVPMHSRCPQPLPVSLGDSDPTAGTGAPPVHPFASLARLKR